MKARSQAAQILSEVQAGQSLAGVWASKTAALPDNQKALCRELVYGSLREWPCIDAMIGQLLQKPLKEKDRDIHALLAIGIYQLDHMRVPPHAAVSETVAAVTALNKGWARGLVNGVLRNYQRRGASLTASLSPAAAAALPDWLHGTLAREWPAQLADIAAAARHHPPMFLRINGQMTQRDEALEMLAAAGIPAAPHPSVESALLLETPCDVSLLPGFEGGHYSVQDAAAQIAAPLLAPRAGERILDACAAPGGKTCHIAELLADPSKLLAADASMSRLSQVRENRDRLGLSFDVLECDARDPNPVLTGRSFDAILLDVPCSATGVMRRNPDVKIIRRPADIARFNQLQQAILAGVWPFLKPGGRLLYATCSLLAAENDDIVEWARATLPGASLRALSHPIGTPTQHGIQCMPSLQGGDGLYYAMLAKQG